MPAVEATPPNMMAPPGDNRFAKMATEADTTEKTDMAAPLTRVFPEPIRSCAIWAPSDIISAPSAYPVVTAAAEVAKILYSPGATLKSLGRHAPDALLEL